MKRSSCRRRGTMYVMVLMTAMLVTVIGISALELSRIQFRVRERENDVIAARYLALSAIEAGFKSIAADADWRTTFTHDEWEMRTELGGGEFAWKLFDVDNADLAADACSSVRLFGRGAVGDAVRVYSALLRSPLPDANLLIDGGMEDHKLGGWDEVSCVSGTGCALASEKKDAHGGTRFVEVSSRNNAWSGPSQDVSAVIAADVPYSVAAWVKLSSAEYVRVTIYVDGSGSSAKAYSTDWVKVETSWTEVSGTVTPTWSGALEFACLYISTYSTTQDMSVDDVSMIADTGAGVALVAGSLRREPDS